MVNLRAPKNNGAAPGRRAAPAQLGRSSCIIVGLEALKRRRRRRFTSRHSAQSSPRPRRFQVVCHTEPSVCVCVRCGCGGPVALHHY